MRWCIFIAVSLMLPLCCISPAPSASALNASAGPVRDIDLEALEGHVHKLVNREREREKMAPLKYHTRLVELSRTHSADMSTRDYVAHVNPEGAGPTDRAKNAGFECNTRGENGIFPASIGENIFMSYLYARYETQTINGIEKRTYDWKSQESLAREIVSSWMQSPGHRENILRPDYHYEGIGIATNINYQVYVTQTFC